MIEVNLLPGSKKTKRSGGGLPSINFAAIGAAIASRINDRYLAAAVVTSALALGMIAFLFLSTQRRESELNAAVETAVADSARHAAVLNDRARAQSRRDSALIQLNIIRAIDEDRYIWPHVMEEISRALPIYTWLTSVALTGTQQGLTPAASVVKLPVPDTGKVRRRRTADPVIPRDTVNISIVGRTVDNMAFTRFMRSLEDSPFLQDVDLVRSEIQVEAGKDVTQFTLNLRYTRPDTTLLTRTPLTLTQR